MYDRCVTFGVSHWQLDARGYGELAAGSPYHPIAARASGFEAKEVSHYLKERQMKIDGAWP
jgi:hypothetical protein